MKNMYLSAPLPFVGQKRRFARDFIKVLEQYPDGTMFVDLFGGSGLLSHLARRCKPHSKVVYNDYDGYSQRLRYIPETNTLLARLREIVRDIPRNRRITGEARQQVLDALREHERLYGYLDYITISTSLLFSMKYALSLADMEKETLYNSVRLSDFPPADDYLEGITIVTADYREVFNQYKDVPGVVFLVDPPYLSTEVGTYSMYWRLSDYLDVLTILAGHRFVYFTSNKSSILELCDWMGRHPTVGNPFAQCKCVEFNARMNYNSAYTDIMLYKPAA